MAASSFFALLDDIATLLDDVAVMSKVAVKKTAGVLGDDLALNAQQVAGVNADRELPVVWAVAKGSLINKVILVPLALLISVFLPVLITPMLMLGGLYLCFEGVEKLAHKWLHAPEEDKAHVQALREAVVNEQVDLVAFEKDKIKGAIRTDFVLSAEIIVITLGTVALASTSEKIIVLSSVAALMTVAVYGLVAGIVRLDDWGLHMVQQATKAGHTSGGRAAVGRAVLGFAPWLMKFLSVAGTAAMFLVGGSILGHGIGPVHHWVTDQVASLSGAGPWASAIGWLLPLVVDLLVGVLAGLAALVAYTGFGRLWGAFRR